MSRGENDKAVTYIACYIIRFFSLLLDQQSARLESGLGVMDYQSCSEASTNITSNRPKNYKKWSEKERYEIGKYAVIHGSRAAERKFHTKEKPLSESNARRFSKLYKEEISKAQKNNRDVNRNLSVLPRGRPLLLGSLDQMVQRFLLFLRRTCIFFCLHICRKGFNCTKSPI